MCMCDYEAQSVFKLTTLLPLFPEYWDYEDMPPHLASITLIVEVHKSGYIAVSDICVLLRIVHCSVSFQLPLGLPFLQFGPP
jgi:hypothetical protein